MDKTLEKEDFVSVIMPVFNAERYLRESIESVLNQTYKNFEFIIINDGSTDDSEAIIKSYHDTRIRYEKHPDNLGLVDALNRAISISGGYYIFRMDADDVCFPDRLEQQLNFLKTHPHLDLIGSKALFFSDNEAEGIIRGDGINSDYFLKMMLLLGSPFIHPTVVMKKDKQNLRHLYYSPGYKYAEDYEMFTRNACFLKYGYCDAVVLKYREHQSVQRQSSDVHRQRNKAITFGLRLNYFKQCEIQINKRLIAHYEDMFYNDAVLSKYSCIKAVLFYSKVLNHFIDNAPTDLPQSLIKKYFRKIFYNSFYPFSRVGPRALMIYLKYGRQQFKMSMLQECKFALKSIFKK